jgi:hypothetical protein
MNNILETLRDDEQYYGEFGKQYLSNSDIGSLLTNPNEFGASREDTPIFAKGRYFHQLILEPEKAANFKSFDSSSRNTKGYKEYCLESNLDFVLLDKELVEIRSWADAMLSNFDFFDQIRNDDNLYEVPGIAEIGGVMWKGKADIVHPDMLIDLKTTGNINDFKWSARKYNYDSQAYIYEQIFGKPLVFYVVDKTTKMLGIFKPTVESLNRGRDKVLRAIEVYNKFFAEGSLNDINNYFISEEI